VGASAPKENEMSLLKIIDCLIDTVERTTELSEVHNDKDGTSVSWDEVYAAREGLTPENLAETYFRSVTFINMTEELAKSLRERDVTYGYRYAGDTHEKEAELMLIDIGIRIKT
jgi:hypothetical protein